MNKKKSNMQKLIISTTSKQENYSEQTFDSIRHINEYGQEFWYARELQQALGYNEWRNFLKVLQRAQDSCKTSTGADLEHFVEVNKSLPMPKGGARIIEDYIRFTDKQKNAPVLPTQRRSIAIRLSHIVGMLTAQCELSSISPKALHCMHVNSNTFGAAKQAVSEKISVVCRLLFLYTKSGGLSWRNPKKQHLANGWCRSIAMGPGRHSWTRTSSSRSKRLLNGLQAILWRWRMIRSSGRQL